jgi:thiol-disulfide isomerase/thioredoxin
LVAVASAAVGLAACSSPSRHREADAAAQPVGASASPESARAAQAVHAAPVAAAPAVPVASGAVPAHPGAAAVGQNPLPGQGAAHDASSAASAIGAPVLIPSGTTDVVPQPGHPHAVGGSARAAGAAPASAPAAPRPAPPPPSAQDANIGYDPNAAATSQIMNAVAASQMDGKAVLLDFGANWCAACRVLDKAMHTPKVRSVLEQHYHVVRIDLGNADPAHMQLATQYDALGTFGMPLLVVLNPDGTVRADSARFGQPKYTEADMAAWLNQWVAR